MSGTLESIRIRLGERLATTPGEAKHRLLTEAILDLTEDGTLSPGDRLPNEAELAGALPFSLGTVQKALRSLSELGVIDRRAGRGTLIAGKTSEISDLWQFRFVDPDQNAVYPAYSRVTGLDREGTDGPWHRFLQDTSGYVRIEREIDVAGRFRVFSRFYLGAAVFGSLADRNPDAFEGVHLHAVVRREFGTGTKYITSRIVCTAIPDTVCLRLGLPSAARGLCCGIRGFATGDRPLWFHEIYVPADADPLELRDIRPVRI
ncbi:GntR family transcriptional regulator [uncultured Roseobacter sp.]|uniref:GntR family transcriptional regulator n=1 Tax=uncultured Roseobacter sp. TaxID=114847 RepID=UPI0026080B30|nr:GntR family transcriptional regulator [uncultured Roseobacter sp.]